MEKGFTVVGVADLHLRIIGFRSRFAPAYHRISIWECDPVETYRGPALPVFYLKSNLIYLTMYDGLLPSHPLHRKIYKYSVRWINNFDFSVSVLMS